ncbi:DNA methyltransferase [Sphingomonas turrisvirgatae]|uniref:site-specific DNA-methyltransferase (adenine-specific) n=1 Tax=Sphingomonas turrisvirgatae TaxID=1888892 RepID=A0A1E3M082_9SPHN|nr:DNA methyltransferase [Sphingomonas turrisvirgatae]ODP39452.1 DNA methylase [Sphingomonas turrisvirgatae]
MSQLYYGDNLDVLREHVPDESVDLIYLDPPFNSNANYNILFKSPDGQQSQSQIEAFEDTWHWNDRAEAAFDDVMRSGNTNAFTLLRAMREFLGDNDMMAYLAMMTVRLIELHRVLKPTGSLYLHCDPTASHYLKLLLDGVFGATNFKNEIVWKRTTAHSAARRFGDVHDIILFYSKSGDFTWNEILLPHSDGYSDRYRNEDEKGRVWADDNLTAPGIRNGHSGEAWRGFDVTAKGSHWKISRKAVERIVGADKAASMTTIEKLDLLDADGLIHWPRNGGFPRFKRVLSSGTLVQDVVTDIPPLNSQAQERLGYPTQKPLALLERIIDASSNEGDLVLDPFCGCGTAVHAAQKLGRRWTGIDVTHLAIGLIEKRMSDAYPSLQFDVIGRPQSLADAEELVRRDKHQFELWALSVVDAAPWKGGRKGPDGGIDGIIWFKPDGKKTEKAIVEVKGGATGVKDVGRLAQVMERENAKIGVLLTAQPPTRTMERDAAAVGIWENKYTGRKHARLQILTLDDLFHNRRPDIPWVDTTVGKKAKRETTQQQGTLL